MDKFLMGIYYVPISKPEYPNLSRLKSMIAFYFSKYPQNNFSILLSVQILQNRHFFNGKSKSHSGFAVVEQIRSC